MKDHKYNGWSNYETWNVKLWIDNEEGSYNYWREVTREGWEDSDHDKEDTAYYISKRLKSEITDGAPELQGTYADLLGAALSEVNWYEIAEAMVEDGDFEEDEEDEIEENTATED